MEDLGSILFEQAKMINKMANYDAMEKRTREMKLRIKELETENHKLAEANEEMIDRLHRLENF